MNAKQALAVNSLFFLLCPLACLSMGTRPLCEIDPLKSLNEKKAKEIIQRESQIKQWGQNIIECEYQIAVLMRRQQELKDLYIKSKIDEKMFNNPADEALFMEELKSSLNQELEQYENSWKSESFYNKPFDLSLSDEFGKDLVAQGVGDLALMKFYQVKIYLDRSALIQLLHEWEVALRDLILACNLSVK